MFKEIGGILPPMLERRLQLGTPDDVQWHTPARHRLPPLPPQRPIEEARRDLAGEERHVMAAKMGHARIARPLPDLLMPVESTDPAGFRYPTLLAAARRLKVDAEELARACRDGTTRCYGTSLEIFTLPRQERRMTHTLLPTSPPATLPASRGWIDLATAAKRSGKSVGHLRRWCGAQTMHPAERRSRARDTPNS